MCAKCATPKEEWRVVEEGAGGGEGKFDDEDFDDEDFDDDD